MSRARGTEGKQLELLLPALAFHPPSLGRCWNSPIGVGGSVCEPSHVHHVFASNWTSSILSHPTHSFSHPSPLVVSKN